MRRCRFVFQHRSKHDDLTLSAREYLAAWQ
jgi:hypothetical protein